MKLIVDLLKGAVELDIGLLAQFEPILSMALALLRLRLPPLRLLRNCCRFVVVNDVQCLGLLSLRRPWLITGDQCITAVRSRLRRRLGRGLRICFA